MKRARLCVSLILKVTLVFLLAPAALGQTDCPDISGVWHNSGTVQLVVTVNGIRQPQPPQAINETFELVQSNCTVSRPGFPDSGTISNNALTLTGPFLVGPGCGSTYTMVGTISGSEIPWTESIYGVCSGPGYVLVITGSGAGVMRRPQPTLEFALTATNTVLLSWPSAYTGYVLQQNYALGTTNWMDVAVTPADDSTNKSVVINLSLGSSFYRLRSQ